MNKESKYDYLEHFHKELGDNINLLLEDIEKSKIPKETIYWERPIKIKSGFVRLGFDKKSFNFYLGGKNLDGNYQRIML